MKSALYIALILLACVSCKSTEPISQDEESTPVTVQEPTPAPVTLADTTSIRVTTFSTDPVNNVFLFDSTESGWKGTLYRYQLTENRTPQVIDILQMTPKNDWIEFNDFVSFLDIFNIPDASEVENLKTFPNPNNIVIQFEVSRKENKRSYAYANPAAEFGSHWTTDNINTFITYITSDFNFARGN